MTSFISLLLFVVGNLWLVVGVTLHALHASGLELCLAIGGSQLFASIFLFTLRVLRRPPSP